MADSFVGYQPEGPIPGRPWWRETDTGVEWTRNDGRVLTLDDQPRRGKYEPAWMDSGVLIAWLDTPGLDLARVCAQIDVEHPRPCPPPMVGQVWTDPYDGDTRQIVGFSDGAPYAVGVLYDGAVDGSPVLEPAFIADPFPPPGAVLVYGPGAPWAPADYTPGESPREEK